MSIGCHYNQSLPLIRGGCVRQGLARRGALRLADTRVPLGRSRCESFSDSLLPPRGLRGGQRESPWREVCQTGPLLAPSMAFGGPREGPEGRIRDGGSSERSDCTSHDGPFPRLRSGQAFGRRAMCLAEPLRSRGHQPPTLAARLVQWESHESRMGFSKCCPLSEEMEANL